MSYADGYDALKRMVRGFDSYQIAFHLIEVDGIWKGKDLERAANRIRACLSRAKGEFFHFSEIIAITRFTKQYDAVFFLCDALGLSRPFPLSMPEQVERLRGSIEQASRTLEAASEALARIEAPREPRFGVPGPDPALQFRRQKASVEAWLDAVLPDEPDSEAMP